MHHHMNPSAFQMRPDHNDITTENQRWDFLYGITSHATSVLRQSGCDPQTDRIRLRELGEQHSIHDLFSFSQKEGRRMFKIISVIWQLYGLFLQRDQQDINSLTPQQIRDFSNAKFRLRNRLLGLVPESVGEYIHEAIRQELEEEALRSFPCDYEQQAEYLSQYGYELSY